MCMDVQKNNKTKNKKYLLIIVYITLSKMVLNGNRREEILKCILNNFFNNTMRGT